MRRVSCAFAALALAAGCNPEIVLTPHELVLRLPPEVGETCRPTGPATGLEVSATGDFPADESTVEAVPLGETMPMPIDSFPQETTDLVLTLQSDSDPDYVGAALYALPASASRDQVLFLPPGRSCALGDTTLVAREGAAIAPTLRHGLVIAGGIREGVAERSIVYAPVDGDLALVAGDLTARRAFATATRTGDFIVVAGGAETVDGRANDSYDVLDAVTGAPIDSGALCDGVCPRREHGAGVLPDGRVLLVGGVEEPGMPPLATMIAIDPATGEVDESFVPLGGEDSPEGRRAPTVLALDDGSTAIVGGYDGTGAPRGSVFLLAEGATEAFPVVISGRIGPTLPNREGAVAVALPGARIAWLGGPTGPRFDAVTVLVLAAAPEVIDLVVDDFVPLFAARAVALEDGRILATGHEVDASGPLVGLRVDVGRGIAERLEAPAQLPVALVGLADGVIAELGTQDTYSSLRRELVRSEWESPPATLVADDAEWLAPDVATHVMVGPLGITAIVDARVDVAGVVFGDVAFEPTASSDIDVTLQDDAGTEARVLFRETETCVNLCRLVHEPGERVRVERLGGAIVFQAESGASRTCAHDLIGPIRLRVGVRTGTTLTALSLARL